MRVDTKICDILEDKSFATCRDFLFPGTLKSNDRKTTLADIAKLFPCHTHVDPDTSVNVLNELQQRSRNGERIFMPFYSAEDCIKNPGLAHTGMFFMKGRKGAPFALICPGGSFEYVGSLHESLPHAMLLSETGFNAFTLHYRTSSPEAACEDLARAISFIFKHAADLGVSTECYSLWGSSVGAHVAAYLASYGTRAFGGDSTPRCGTLVMQYTGHTNHTRQEPPTFVCVGENDLISDWQIMKHRCDDLTEWGMDAEFHKYPHLGHGFGLGKGTTAEGWIKYAIAFWKRHLPVKARKVLLSNSKNTR